MCKGFAILKTEIPPACAKGRPKRENKGAKARKKSAPQFPKKGASTREDNGPGMQEAKPLPKNSNRGEGEAKVGC